jgi:hypothetical protein
MNSLVKNNARSDVHIKSCLNSHAGLSVRYMTIKKLKEQNTCTETIVSVLLLKFIEKSSIGTEIFCV